MSERRLTARIRAHRYLESRIREFCQAGKNRLPTVAELARDARTSPAAMLQAVHDFSREGVLTAGQRRGISIVRHPRRTEAGVPEEPNRREMQPKWVRVRSCIQADILHGRYAPGVRLPSQKELMQRYGVCRRTLRKALVSLQSAGRIVPDRATYRVPRLSCRGSDSRVVLIGRRHADGSLLFTTGRTQEQLRALERESSQAGVRLATGGVSHAATEFLHGQTSPLRKLVGTRSALLGFVVWTSGMNRWAVPPLLQHLLGYNKPVAVLEEAEDLHLAATTLANPLLRLFGMSYSTLPGEQVGRYLLSLGHRRVAFLSHSHHATWSVRRQQGLVAAFDSARLPNALRSFVLDTAVPTAKLAARAGELTTRIESVFPPASTQPAPDKPRLSRPLADLRSNISLFQKSHMLSSALAPLLRSALQDRSITAWVAANDTVAMTCLDFLKAEGIAVPGKLSVVGFDDSLEASANKLTSYNFNAGPLMHAMLEHVIAPRRGGRSRRPTDTTEVEGFITERETAGPVG